MAVKEFNKKEFDAVKSSFIAYQLYEETARESIIKLLENHFNFTITENNNTIEIDIGGDEYRIALERGWIVFEYMDNDYVENTYCVNTIEDLIDIITELKEDK